MNMVNNLMASLLAGLLLPGTAFAQEEYTYNVIQDAHKVRNKWDLTGSYIQCPGYCFDGASAWSVWTFAIHVKEAMNPDYSVGSIEFACGDLVVTGDVKSLKHSYAYWYYRPDNIALAGTAYFQGTTWSFILLYDIDAVHLMLFDSAWEIPWAENAIPAGIVYETHNLPDVADLPVDCKTIHIDITP